MEKKKFFIVGMPILLLLVVWFSYSTYYRPAEDNLASIWIAQKRYDTFITAVSNPDNYSVEASPEELADLDFGECFTQEDKVMTLPNGYGTSVSYGTGLYILNFTLNTGEKYLLYGYPNRVLITATDLDGKEWNFDVSNTFGLDILSEQFWRSHMTE